MSSGSPDRSTSSSSFATPTSFSYTKYFRHLHEIIETPKQLFLVMEYMQNGELFDYIVKMKKYHRAHVGSLKRKPAECSSRS